MPKWVVYCVVTIVIWGAWGIVSGKADAAGVSPMANLILFTLGLVPPVIAVSLSPNVKVGTNKRLGLLWGVATGIAGGLGNIAFYAAIAQGKVSVVLPLTCIYPLVTLLIAVAAMRERINVVQMGGIAAALVALVVLSANEETWRDPMAFVRGLATSWMAYTLIAVLFWGITGNTQKLATNHVSPELSLLGYAAGFLPLSIAVLLFGNVSWGFSRAGWGWAILGGAMMGFGTLTSFAAYRNGGKASVVTPLTGLYPVLTVLLAFPILGERVYLREAIGITIALAAAVALAYETPREREETPPAGFPVVTQKADI